MEAVANYSTPRYCFSDGVENASGDKVIYQRTLSPRLSANYMGFVMLLIVRFHVLYTCGVWLMRS